MFIKIKVFFLLLLLLKTVSNSDRVVLAWDIKDSPPAWLPSLLEVKSASSVVKSAEWIDLDESPTDWFVILNIQKETYNLNVSLSFPFTLPCLPITSREMWSKLDFVNGCLYVFFWLLINSLSVFKCVCLRKQQRLWGACVKSASTGSHPMRAAQCVCGRVFWAHGTRLEEWGVSSPQLFFCLLPWEVGKGWENGLLTTSPSPSATSPPLWGARHGQEERGEAALNSTHYPCLFFQIQHASACISVICFPLLVDQQRSLRFEEFVYFHEWLSDWWICSSGATEWLWNVAVRKARGGEINTSGEIDEKSLLRAVGIILKERDVSAMDLLIVQNL